jgi:hypothetical protein
LRSTQVCSYSKSVTSRRKMKKKINRNLNSTSLESESGDVPGWVLITLMTAGLVVLMWAVAGPALKGVFEQAMTKVANF